MTAPEYDPRVFVAQLDLSTPVTIAEALTRGSAELRAKANAKAEEATNLRRSAAALATSVEGSDAADKLRREAAAADADAEELIAKARAFGDTADSVLGKGARAIGA